MKKLFLILPVFSLFICLNAAPVLITPDEFEFLGSTSVDVMRAFNRGLSVIQKYDPVFFLDADTIQAISKEGFLIPLKYNEQKVGTIQGDMTLYWRPFKEDNWSLAFFSSISSMDLQVKEGGNISTSVYGWKNRFMIIGIKTTIYDFMKISSGYIYKFSPIILKDEFGEKYFSAEMDEKNEIKHNESYNGFFHTDILGIDLGTVFKSGQGIDFVEFKIPFYFNENRLIIKPDIGYFNFHDIVKTGAMISNEFPVKIEGTKIDAIIIELEGYARIYARDDWVGPATAILNINLTGGREKISDKSIKNLESYASLKIGGSYSKELFCAGVAGAIIELGYENFCLFENHYLSCNFGVAYNYHYSLYRMPVRNFCLIPFTIRWMF